MKGLLTVLVVGCDTSSHSDHHYPSRLQDHLRFYSWQDGPGNSLTKSGHQGQARGVWWGRTGMSHFLLPTRAHFPEQHMDQKESQGFFSAGGRVNKRQGGRSGLWIPDRSAVKVSPLGLPSVPILPCLAVSRVSNPEWNSENK